MQVALDVAPTAREYVPTGHEMGAVRPVSEQYDPAVHLIHSKAPGVVEYVPIEHAEQLVAFL